MYTHIFLDMDGVIADFSAAAAALFGKEAPGPETSGQSTHEVLGITRGQLWSRIDEAGRNFWEHIPATPFANDLITLAKAHGQLHVLTSPSMDPSCAAGKIRWLQRKFGRRFRDFSIAPKKALFAAPGRLLVDDREQHTEPFVAAGGQAIVFPTWENGLRQTDTDPVDAVRKVLEAGVPTQSQLQI